MNEPTPPPVLPLPWARLNFKGDHTDPTRSNLLLTVFGPSTFESGGMYYVVAEAHYDPEEDMTRCVMGSALLWHMVMAGLVDAPPGWSP